MPLNSHRSLTRISVGLIAAALALPAAALTASPAFADDEFLEGDYCDHWEVTVTTIVETGETETTRVCNPGALGPLTTVDYSPDGCVVGGWSWYYDPATQGDVRYELTPDTECLAAHTQQEVVAVDEDEQVDVVAVDEEEQVDAYAYEGRMEAVAYDPDAEGVEIVAIEH